MFYLECDVFGYKIRGIYCECCGVIGPQRLPLWAWCLCCVPPLNDRFGCPCSFDCYERFERWYDYFFSVKLNSHSEIGYEEKTNKKTEHS